MNPSKEILNEAKKNLGACGLNCGKCIFNRYGDIRDHAEEMKKLLGNFDSFAERFSTFDDVFKKYPQFKDFLSSLTKADCEGCRGGGCKYPNCGVQPCAAERGVDFCFQCDDFPCDKSNFDEDLKARWIIMNEEMKKEGVEAWFGRTKNFPRYK